MLLIKMNIMKDTYTKQNKQDVISLGPTQFRLSLLSNLLLLAMIFLLLAGLGKEITTPLIYDDSSEWAGTFLSLTFMLLLLGLTRCPFIIIKNYYNNCCNMHKVNITTLIWEQLISALKFGFPTLIGSYLALWFLKNYSLIYSIFFIALIIVCFLSISYWVFLNLDMLSYEKIHKDYLSPIFIDNLTQWALKSNVQISDILVSSKNINKFKLPYITGIFAQYKIIIPKCIFDTFTNREIEYLITSRIIAITAKYPMKIFILKIFLSLICLPLTFFFITYFGGYFGYPMQIDPTLILLIWLSILITKGITDFSVNFINREIAPKIDAATIVLTKDISTFKSILNKLAQSKAANSHPPFWQLLFLPHLDVDSHYQKVLENIK